MPFAAVVALGHEASPVKLEADPKPQIEDFKIQGSELRGFRAHQDSGFRFKSYRFRVDF